MTFDEREKERKRRAAERWMTWTFYVSIGQFVVLVVIATLLFLR